MTSISLLSPCVMSNQVFVVSVNSVKFPGMMLDSIFGSLEGLGSSKAVINFFFFFLINLVIEFVKTALCFLYMAVIFRCLFVSQVQHEPKTIFFFLLIYFF